MKGFTRIVLSTLAVAAVVLTAASCGGSAQTITKEQDEQYRNPPKNPPAEYKPNQIGTPPPAPPAGQKK